ncbi:YpiB family protein [Staphylococcus xylosus]|uniref:YpiB family protein n=1 Tax=Staphylococcus xylosus TaxID=1288 RepID=A0A939NDT8_STAXY|nr:YpiB family protein [Staphylococcus xylosus]
MFDTLQQSKATFIEYLLFQYEFKSRISVWVLNLLKSSPELLQNVHFVDERIDAHNTLEISMIHTEQYGIKFNYKNQELINSNEIFEHIALNQLSFDIKLNFNVKQDREARLDLLIKQLLHSPYYALYIQDIYQIPLSKQSESSIITHLQDNIDLSLQLHDSDLFYQLSQILILLS